MICDEKPNFLGVSEILRRSAEHTKALLKQELEIKLDELNGQWHSTSLEKIFIENKLYQLIEGCRSREEAYEAVDKGLEPFKKLLQREVTRDDVIKLTQLQFIRISKYDSTKADELIRGIEEDIRKVKHDLKHLTEYAVAYYNRIKEKYGKGRERRSELREFDSIEAAKVVVANAKLYVNRAEGFFGIGASMRKDEFVCDCSDLDEVLVMTKDGRYEVTKVQDKAFFDKNIYYIGIFKRNDERTIYNILDRDGKAGAIMMKRCAIKGVTRDKVYDITKGTPKSEVIYMTVNPNGEAEVLKVYFKPRPRLKRAIVDLDFSTLAIKGRQSQGNLFSRYGIHKIVMKERGTSTLGGQNIYFDEDIMRLNSDGRGRLLGEFSGDDRIIVMTAKNLYYTTGYDLGHHFPEDLISVEKFDSARVYSVVYFDKVAGYFYLKRFNAESGDKMQYFLDEDGSMQLIAISTDERPRLEITYKGAQASRPADTVTVADFIGIKSHRAKGKRLSTYDIDTLTFIEPEEVPEEEQPTQPVVAEPVAAEGGDDIDFEIIRNAPDEEIEMESGEQLNLF